MNENVATGTVVLTMYIEVIIAVDRHHHDDPSTRN